MLEDKDRVGRDARRRIYHRVLFRLLNIPLHHRRVHAAPSRRSKSRRCLNKPGQGRTNISGKGRRWRYLGCDGIATTCLQPGHRQREISTESVTLVSLVGTARQSAAENDQCASIVKTSRSPVIMPMGSEIGLRGKQYTINVSGMTLSCFREFGSMASKVEEYEKVLRFLSGRLEGPGQALVQRVLEKVRTRALPCL